MNYFPIILALFSMFFWALWVVLADVSTESYTSGQTYLYIVAVNVIIGFFYVGFADSGSVIPDNLSNIGLLLLTGVCSSFGSIFFYEAIERSGESSGIVFTITALYFVVSVVIGWAFLGDTLELRQWLGVAFAATSIVLIAI